MTQQAINVLVNPTLLGRMRRREVCFGLERRRHFLVLNEFGPVIEGERLHLVRHGSEEANDSLLSQ